MQDRYVGDVGDYGKYGLLRALAGGDLRLGVVWWLKSEPDSDRDGRHLSGVLPAGTVFHSNPVPEARQRAAWCEDALLATRDADLVFHDPDNGLASEVPSGKRGPKCLAPEELRPYLDRGQSLVVYHHQTREAPLPQQVARWMIELRQLPVHDAWALSFHRWSVRTFFVLATEPHAEILRQRIEGFLASPWGIGRSPHFKLQPIVAAV